MSKNMLASAADHFWFTRALYRVGDSEPRRDFIRELTAAAFTAGAQWSLRETTRMSPYVNQFLHMCVLLGVWENETDQLRDATGGDQATTGAASYQTEPPY